MARRLVVASVVRPLVLVSAVRLLAVPGWVRLRAVASADQVLVRRRIKVLVVVVFNNNSRWEWEELQCKVVREWVRVWRRVACNRTVVRLVAAR